MAQFRTLACRSLLITMLGRHLAGRGTAVYSGTFIDVLGQAGFGPHAVRSALARMVPRDQLRRHRHGRRTYFALSPSMEHLLLQGRQRIYETDPVLADWDGEWTLLSFSLPEEHRAERHRLRVRLAWAGFGSLRHGLWVAPGRLEHRTLVDDIPVVGNLHCFRGRLNDPTTPRTIVDRAWDLDEMDRAYREFLARWARPEEAPGTGVLARHLWLITDWRLLLRETQPLPEDVVPPNWPARRAWTRFHELDQQWGADAADIFGAMCEAVPVTVEAPEPRDSAI